MEALKNEILRRFDYIDADRYHETSEYIETKWAKEFVLETLEGLLHDDELHQVLESPLNIEIIKLYFYSKCSLDIFKQELDIFIEELEVKALIDWEFAKDCEATDDAYVIWKAY